MNTRIVVTVLIAAAIATGPVTRAGADGDAIVGGIIGGIIGGAIVNESNKNQRTRTKTVYRNRTVVSSPQRAENRQVQTALNYFGFPAGAADGVFGRNTRAAVSNYQAYMGYVPSGQLTDYEKNFLLTSYQRAQAGGALTMQQIAGNPQGPKGLLLEYRNQMAGTGGTVMAVAPAPVTPEPAPAAPVPVIAEAPAEPDTGMALPNFMGSSAQLSLASHCNTVSLLTNSNGGFTTLANMTDPDLALGEQFCIARTYAIAQGEELAGRVQGFSAQQIAEQCQAFGPSMSSYVNELSLQAAPTVMQDTAGFVRQSGMSPAQLAGTARICLSVGYRTDDMDVAVGSALLLAALGEPVYGELLGHHLTLGFGTAQRRDLALAWYDMSLSALEAGTPAIFAPGQPERNDLIRAAAHRTTPAATATPLPVLGTGEGAAALPGFEISQ